MSNYTHETVPAQFVEAIMASAMHYCADSANRARCRCSFWGTSTPTWTAGDPDVTVNSLALRIMGVILFDNAGVMALPEEKLRTPSRR